MNRIDDGKNTAKAIVFNIISITISIIVSLITTVLITKVISLSDLGIATSFITLKSIFTIICLLSIYSSVNRMMLDVDGDDYHFLSSIYIFSSLICITIYIIYIIFHRWINVLTGFDFKIMSLMFFMIFLINGGTLLVSYWTFKNKYKLNFIYSILCNPISQVLSLIFSYLLVTHKYIGRIIGIDIFNILFGIICGIYILFKGQFKYRKKYIKQSLKICIPMIPHLLAQLLLTSCDLIMVKNISGAEKAGIYGMAYTIANLLYAVLIQLFNPWSPWIYRRLKNNEIDSIYNNSKAMMSFCFILCIGLMCVCPEVIKLLLDVKYYSAINLIAPICIGIFFQIMYIFFYDIEYFYKKTKQIAFFSVITAILNIVLNYFFIKKFGYSAAAYTTLISYFILLLLHYTGMKKIEKRKIYNIKYMVLLSIILVLYLIVMLLLNNNIVVRYLFFTICLFIMVFINRKIIKNYILKIRNAICMKRGVVND